MKRLFLSLILGSSVTALAQFGPQLLINQNITRPYLSVPHDVDNDGFVDVISASPDDFHLIWYRNEDGAGTFSQELSISETPTDYHDIFIEDVDGDGDEDLMFSSYYDSYAGWYENIDGSGTFGPQKTIAHQPGQIGIGIPADLDNDGDIDYICSQTQNEMSQVFWYENIDGQGNFSDGQLVLEYQEALAAIGMHDIDNDGFLDFVASNEVLYSGKLFWLKNMGDGTFGAEVILFQYGLITTGGHHIFQFQFDDLNSDGKEDLIIASNYADEYDTIDWLENIDNAGTFGTPRLLLNFNRSYVLCDLDNDTDLDMLHWNNITDELAWKENLGGAPLFAPSITITNAIDYPLDANAADFNGDGYLDLVSASQFDDKLAWYPNNILSVNDVADDSFTLSPNPTTGTITLHGSLPVDSVKISNLLGQQVAQFTSEEIIDISHLTAGVYLVRIATTGENLKTIKIVKQ
jgi:hypothetical protein